MNEKAQKWLFSRDTGLSSEAILQFMEGIESDRGYAHPLDPDDLGRCLRLLLFVPGYKARLPEMVNASASWAALIPIWDEIEKLYYEELPSGKAPKCYARMREVLDPVRDTRRLMFVIKGTNE